MYMCIYVCVYVEPRSLAPSAKRLPPPPCRASSLRLGRGVWVALVAIAPELESVSSRDRERECERERDVHIYAYRDTYLSIFSTHLLQTY